jgi:3-(3-hydroxy-phenyl)propionate hydroxylase
VVVDAWERAPTSFPKMNTQYCWPSRPASAITGPRNLRRWELKILPQEKPEEFHDQARVRDVLKDFIEIDAIELWRSAVYRFHALVADRWSHGRIFLLGDSAHQTPPFLGQGMCAGIRDASNLVWKLLLVEKAGASPSLLNSYQEERKVHVKNVVEQAKDLGLVIGELDLEAAKHRDARLHAERTRAGGDPLRHRLIPPLSGGLIDCDDQGKPRQAAGTLFPQPTVTTMDGRTALMDDVLPPAFLVVSRAVDAQSALNEEATAMLRRIGGIRVLLRAPGDANQTVPPDVVVLTEQDPLFANWLAESGAVAAVVRPDRYVYGIARTPADLQHLLKGLSNSLFNG